MVYAASDEVQGRREHLSTFTRARSNSSDDINSSTSAAKRLHLAESPATANSAVRQAADRTYSKNSTVQNVYVPADMERVIAEDQHVDKA